MSFVNDQYGRKIGLVKLTYYNLWLFLGGFRKYRNLNWSRVRRLVFICKGNISRSAFGDAYAKHKGINSNSAGLTAAVEEMAADMSIITAKIYKVDLTKHRTTNIYDFKVKDGDLFLCMEPTQAEYILDYLGENNFCDNTQVSLLGLWSNNRRTYLQDPYGLKEPYWNVCFHIIRSAVDNIYLRLINENE